LLGGIGADFGKSGSTRTSEGQSKKIAPEFVPLPFLKCFRRHCWAGEIWRSEYLVVLACVLRTATKKSRQLFDGKSAPPDKILATPVAVLLPLFGFGREQP